MLFLHALLPHSTLAACSKNKSFYKNEEKCDASFLWVIDDVRCCETLHQSQAGGSVEAGRWEGLPVGIEVLICGVVQAQTRRIAGLVWKNAWLRISRIVEIVSMFLIYYWERFNNTIFSDIRTLTIPEHESLTTVQSLKGCIGLGIIPHFV